MIITTSTGTTIATKPSEHGTLIILDHPDAPDDMRNKEVGRIDPTFGGFQPAVFSAWSMSAETLHGIATILEARA